MRSNVMGHCYLIHFSQPYVHARHYLGWSENLTSRLTSHRAGGGARLMRVIQDAGIEWELARVWEGDRHLERSLKQRKNTGRLCPICRGVGVGIVWDSPLADCQMMLAGTGT